MGWVDTPVYERRALAPGMQLKGPAVIEEPGATVVLGPGHGLRVDPHGNLIVTLPSTPGEQGTP